MTPVSEATSAVADRYRLPLLLVLTGAGLIANCFTVPIYHGINIIFGSIFALLAVQLLGFGRGVLVGLIVSTLTWFHWHHPYAIITLTCEVAAVDYLVRRRPFSFVLADAVYWLCLGGPLTYLYCHLVMGVSLNNTMTIMFKQSLNGITCALMARLLFQAVMLCQRRIQLPLREIIFNLLSLFMLFPVLLLLALEGRHSFTTYEKGIRQSLATHGRMVGTSLDSWLDDKIQHVHYLAKMAANLPTDSMQAHLEHTRQGDFPLLRVGLMDVNATTVAFSPLRDELGQSNLGKNFAERPFVPQLKQTLKPMLSEVVMGKIGQQYPLVLALAPVIKKGVYAGFVSGVIDLKEIRTLVKGLTGTQGLEFVLLDKNRRVIVSSHPELTTMQPYTRRAGAEKRLEGAITRWQPSLTERVPPLEQWGRSSYLATSKAGRLSEWELVLELPIAPFQKKLNDHFIAVMSLLGALILATLVLASFFSRRLTAAFESLGTLTNGLAPRIESGGTVMWPTSSIKEIGSLIVNVRDMSKSLERQFREIRHTNESLEELVEGRTRELTRAKEAWEETFNSVNDLIYIVADDEIIVHANRAMLERLGVTLDEIIGRSCFEVVHGTQAPPDECSHGMKLKERRRHSQDLYIERLKGYFTIAETPLSNAVGTLVGSVHICHDITERKMVEEALRLSERSYRELIEHARTVILRLDAHGEVNYINDFGEKAFGYKRGELIGRNVVGTIVPETDAASRDLRQMMSNLIARTAEYSETENENITHDGRRLWMHWHNTAVYEEDGSLIEILSVGSDVTARKEAEDRLLETNLYLEKAVQRSNELADEAARANAAKSEFLANMSHEIRTPMNGVIAMSSLLAGTALNEEQRGYAAIIHKSGRHLMDIINDILDYSKIEARRMELEEIPFDLADVLAGVQQILQPAVSEKGLELSGLIESDVPTLVWGDPARLRRILLNLVSNAVKFTERGRVALRISLDSQEEEQLTLHFTVSDTGIGIPAEKLPLIFNPFTQADNSTTRRFGGTGLGLSISRQLAELMGGELTVTSREGEGSVFSFTARLKQLPVSEAEQLPTEEREYEPLSQAAVFAEYHRKSRILVVEDNPTNQKVAGALLEKAGFRYTLVASGFEALNFLEEEPFDLVLMDCQMPGLDGYETTALIRSPHLAVLRHDIPIIAMTANALEGDRERCLEAGMDDYLPKPVEVTRLVPLLEKWLALEGCRDHSEQSVVGQGIGSTASQVGEQAPEAPIFDEADYLRRNLDDRSLAQDVLNMFVAGAPGYLAALQERLEARDDGGVRMQAHTIKGACATVGAERMRATALELEQLSRAGDLTSAVAVAERLNVDFRRLTEELQQRGWLQQ